MIRVASTKAVCAMTLCLITLAACYHGPSNADPREYNANGVVPWGTQLLPGKTSDASGIGYVTRRDECCGVAITSEFQVPDVRGVNALFFDVRVPTAGRKIAIDFGTGQRATTDAMASGPQTIRVRLPPAAIGSDGTARVRLTISAQAPDHVAQADGPTVMAIYGVVSDRELDPASAVLGTIVDAK